MCVRQQVIYPCWRTLYGRIARSADIIDTRIYDTIRGAVPAILVAGVGILSV